MASSEKILRTCVHCGFCTATCPTYLLLGDELDCPRGRIYLIKDMLEGGKPATPEVVKHIDRCLSCLSCMTTCPSGVHYMHLVDHARAHIEETYRAAAGRPAAARACSRVVLPYPGRFRLALLRRAGSARPLRAAGRRAAAASATGSARCSTSRPRSRRRAPLAPAGRGRFAAAGRARGRGSRSCRAAPSRCCEPAINEAAIRLLDPARRRGRAGRGRGLLRRARPPHGPRATTPRLRAGATSTPGSPRSTGEGLDAIVITASGCGTTIKDYGFMFRDDPAYAEKAARVSALAKDVTEYLATLDLMPPVRETGPRRSPITPPARCSTASRSATEPKTLLQARGLHGEGRAGGPHLLRLGRHLQHPAAGDRRRGCATRKVANIERIAPDLIATGNIGCMTQIGHGTGIPIVHTVELLDWATGGPMPEPLQGLGMERQAAAE